MHTSVQVVNRSFIRFCDSASLFSSLSAVAFMLDFVGTRPLSNN
jgi:hypothetical protein